ncbi:putative signal transduction protein with Nacht domain [Streptomyces lincolnensis]|uniref:Putative signal transduction protein with Nacht domain n=1 Tax=Streptomyces lincolnensis TaxID=1915 RepID=A0A1B1MM47_STRLN|nr:putative signal transduction protein with Nacht domain [Streptomyces lincolnensis]AXG58542.1 putative signal transduction protein with Nacht domain [Streptomyces lincolnensis]
MRSVLRLLGGAALTVAVGVATNQVYSDKGLSWTWLYASFGLGVLVLLYTEVWAAPSPAGAADGAPAAGRGQRGIYLRQLRENVRDMETVGIATQGEFVLRMRQVYVDVSLTSQVLHAVAGEPYLGALPGGEPTGLGRRRSLESVLRDAERGDGARVLAVIGGPGSGKTTLARNTALGLCEHRWRPSKRRLPVLLYLRDHAEALLAPSAPGLGAVAVAASWLDGKVTARWLERRLDRGGCVVLLDGLDEVADPAERGRVVAWVGRQTQQYPRNVYVVTSRPHGYQSNPLSGAEVLQVRRFTGEQIERFLHQWSYAIESRARMGTGREVQAAADRNAEDLRSRLRARPALYDLAANPLLLTMIANVHRYRGQLPGSRAELYAEMCDVLLHRRYEARGLRDATGLSGPHKQYVMQHLALAMMKAKIRHWPAHEAADAIDLPLRRVPGDVAAEVFLEEVRKSGLLVEREHGVYGFAHLTLQEYLAAAQLGTPGADLAALTDNVDDGWWRETIQLWAAGNDATAVITACLDSGTVHALALAFDCADQARTVEPAVRGRLEDLLTSTASSPVADPVVQRLLAGILATRTLRETILLDDTSALCAHPVPRSLYALFVQDEEAAGRRHPRAVSGTDAEDTGAPAVGMEAGDAERFVSWVNTLVSEQSYRLPGPGELADHGSAIAAHLNRHTVWAQERDRVLLHQPPGSHWPYPAPTRTRARSLAVDDGRQLTSFLRLLAAPAHQRTRVADWVRVLVGGLTRTPEARDDPGLGRRNFVLDLGLDFALALSLQLVLADALSSGATRRGDPGPALDRARALADALNHDRYHFRSDITALDRIDRALAMDPALDRVRARGIGLDRIGDRPRALNDALVCAFDHALAHSRHHALHFLRAEVTDRLRAFVFALNGIADSAADIRRARQTRGLLGGAPGPDVGVDLAGLLVPTLDLGDDLLDTRDVIDVSDVRMGPVVVPSQTESLALAIDLAGGHVNDPLVSRVTLTAVRTLFAFWRPPAGVGLPGVLADLDDLLGRTVDAIPAPEQPLPEDATTALRQVWDLLRVPSSAPPASLPEQVRTLVNHTGELLTFIRERRTPAGSQAPACARVAILIAITALGEAGQGHEDAVRHLRRIWQSLGAREDSVQSRRTAPNQTLFLTRVHQ